MKYDPERPPEAKTWLDLDESEAIDLVRSYHAKERIGTPNATLHAGFHVIVENQVALAEPAVVQTLIRLQREGLSRHDAIHAIGSVLAGHMHDLMHSKPAPTAEESNGAYAAELRRLTASRWLRQSDDL